MILDIANEPSEPNKRINPDPNLRVIKQINNETDITANFKKIPDMTKT